MQAPMIRHEFETLLMVEEELNNFRRNITMWEYHSARMEGGKSNYFEILNRDLDWLETKFLKAVNRAESAYDLEL